MGGGSSSSPSDGAVTKNQINSVMISQSRSHGGKQRRSAVSVEEGLVWEAEERAETVIKKLRKEPLRRPYRGGNPNLPEGMVAERKMERKGGDLGHNSPGNEDKRAHRGEHDVNEEDGDAGTTVTHETDESNGFTGIIADGAFKAPKVPNFKELMVDISAEHIQKTLNDSTEDACLSNSMKNSIKRSMKQGDSEAGSSSSFGIFADMPELVMDKFQYLQMEESEGLRIPVVLQRKLMGVSVKRGDLAPGSHGHDVGAINIHADTVGNITHGNVHDGISNSNTGGRVHHKRRVAQNMQLGINNEISELYSSLHPAYDNSAGNASNDGNSENTQPVRTHVRPKSAPVSGFGGRKRQQFNPYYYETLMMQAQRPLTLPRVFVEPPEALLQPVGLTNIDQVAAPVHFGYDNDGNLITIVARSHQAILRPKSAAYAPQTDRETEAFLANIVTQNENVRMMIEQNTAKLAQQPMSSTSLGMSPMASPSKPSSPSAVASRSRGHSKSNNPGNPSKPNNPENPSSPSSAGTSGIVGSTIKPEGAEEQVGAEEILEEGLELGGGGEDKEKKKKKERFYMDNKIYGRVINRRVDQRDRVRVPLLIVRNVR